MCLLNGSIIYILIENLWMMTRTSSNLKDLEPFTVHPSMRYLYAPFLAGLWGAGACLLQSMCERQGTPWTGRQSITGHHTDTQDKQSCMQTIIPKGNLNYLFNIMVMLLDHGGKLENPHLHRKDAKDSRFKRS
ncbi:hypothetical protein XENOCAPTIV_015328 [Xenoophorus captivus]|uniref:Uncharacterized protein n=1 Tax=Xenoophorus captivus TaxID=1517983 RepID=A0ABV0QLY6_9TELE